MTDSYINSYIEAWLLSASLCEVSFDRFRTERETVRVLFLSQEESRALGQDRVNTEHILLGLIGVGIGVAPKTLKSIGVNLKEARVEVKKISHQSTSSPLDMPLSANAKKALRYALEEAERLDHSTVGTEHLLLGLIREAEESTIADPQNGAGFVLKNLGIDLTALEKKIRENAT